MRCLGAVQAARYRAWHPTSKRGSYALKALVVAVAALCIFCQVKAIELEVKLGRIFLARRDGC